MVEKFDAPSRIDEIGWGASIHLSPYKMHLGSFISINSQMQLSMLGACYRELLAKLARVIVAGSLFWFLCCSASFCSMQRYGVHDPVSIRRTFLFALTLPFLYRIFFIKIAPLSKKDQRYTEYLHTVIYYCYYICSGDRKSDVC